MFDDAKMTLGPTTTTTLFDVCPATVAALLIVAMAKPDQACGGLSQVRGSVTLNKGQCCGHIAKNRGAKCNM
jgi:hypothetical protein